MLSNTVWTIPEVADYLKVSPSKLYQMVQRGELPSIKIGRQVRITEDDLARWLDGQRSVTTTLHHSP